MKLRSRERKLEVEVKEGKEMTQNFLLSFKWIFRDLLLSSSSKIHKNCYKLGELNLITQINIKFINN